MPEDDTRRTFGMIRQIVREAVYEKRSAAFSDETIIDLAAKKLERIFRDEQSLAIALPSGRTADYYLRLIRRFLVAVRGNVSRDKFMADVFGELSNGRSVTGNVFLVEGYRRIEGAGLAEVEIGHAVWSDPHRGRHLFDTIGTEKKSGFVESLLLASKVLDFELSDVLSATEFGPERYRGEFETLHGKNRAWLCAYPLQATERGEPERALIGVYPLPDEAQRDTIPPGAKQEWDVLGLVPSIFDLLQHRVRDLQETVADEQRRLIMELAPSAITHELGTGLHLMYQHLLDAAKPLRRLAGRLSEDDEDLLELGDALVAINNLIDKSHRTTEAFTNIQRRMPGTTVDLAELVDDLELVLMRRLQDAHASVIRDIPAGLTLVTDTRYVIHVLMNVVLNAVEAIEPVVRAEDDSERAFNIAIEAREVGDSVEIAIANDGPAIPVRLSARIFDKGVTSKPIGTGHGQGLYLCRLIANQLEGHFGFSPPPSLLPGANVSFVLKVPKQARYESDA